MTELHLPVQMSHFVGSGPSSSLPLVHQSKYEQVILPPPHLDLSRLGNVYGLPSSTREPARQNRPITPPLETSDSYGNFGASLQSGFGAGRGDYSATGGRAQPFLSTPTRHQQQQQHHHHQETGRSSFHGISQPGSRASSRQPSQSPRKHSMPAPSDSQGSGKTLNDVIAPSLQIPHSIDTPQASIPQLAAEITCLFWFESSSVIQGIENAASVPLQLKPLSEDAVPSTGFRKWVTTILSTTQVAPNVTLLALLFIYRLKKLNPNVKGKPGSEYRLLTVALMLGNKFLDDNTYTNKTWAEVSGISVQEVHIMEVEFLSNMRYSLFTSEKEWKEWHVKLGKFGTYFDTATKMQMKFSRSFSTSGPSLQHYPTLPSPPSSNNASPPFPGQFSPHVTGQPSVPQRMARNGSAALPPVTPFPDPEMRTKKRSRDEQQGQEPPAKRLSRSFVPQTLGPIQSMVPTAHIPNLPRLPMPNLSIPSTQAPMGRTPAVITAPNPTTKAMSLVYPPPGQWSQPPTSSVPLLPLSYVSTGPQNDHSRQSSPFPGNSSASSPLSASFPSSASHIQNLSRLSPSHYLAERNSPYRPVRGVNTLLVPPPPTSLHNAARNIGYEQMQYQPLSKAINERRVGPVPYMTHEAWPATHQSNQWPTLRQPNFHR